jgi:excisionase family DNA binding protein
MSLPAPYDSRLTVSTTEAAKLIGVNPSRVRQLILTGKLKANKPAGIERHYIMTADLLDFLTTKSAKG